MVFAVVAAIAVVIWMLMIVRGEESPIDPPVDPTITPVSTPASTLSPTVVATPVPTVSIVPTLVPGSLPDLLRYAPDRLANDTLPLSDIARYADIEGWMQARGVEVPSGRGDPSRERWEAELEPLALPEILTARGDEPIWEETYGFRLMDVDQVLAVGQAPDYVLIMRGDFDEAKLQAAWVQSGYQAIRVEDVTMWSLFPGDAVDLSAPASRPSLGNLNNVVLLEDGTLIATSRLSRLEETVRVMREGAPSLGQNPDVAALLAPGAGSESLLTAVIVKGSLLATDPSTPTVLASPPATGTANPLSGSPEPPLPVLQEMPPVTLMLAGLHPPDAGAMPVFALVLSFAGAEDATTAMVRVDRTLREDLSPVTHRAYTERLEPLGMRIVGTGQDDVLLVLQTRPREDVADWLAIIEQRDLGFLSWAWEP